MLGTGLVRCTEREKENGQSGASLLHACVTDFAGSVETTPQLKDLAIDRLSIAAVSRCCCCFALVLRMFCVRNDDGIGVLSLVLFAFVCLLPSAPPLAISHLCRPKYHSRGSDVSSFDWDLQRSMTGWVGLFICTYLYGTCRASVVNAGRDLVFGYCVGIYPF